MDPPENRAVILMHLLHVPCCAGQVSPALAGLAAIAGLSSAQLSSAQFSTAQLSRAQLSTACPLPAVTEGSGGVTHLGHPYVLERKWRNEMAMMIYTDRKRCGKTGIVI